MQGIQVLDIVKKSESPSGLTVGQTESFPHLGACQSGDRVLQNCTDKTISPRSLVREPLTKKKTIKDIERKVKIIAWLLPRFHKGISDPKQYEKLIGKVEQ